MENLGAILMKNDSFSVIGLSYLQYASLAVTSLVVKVKTTWHMTANRFLIPNTLLIKIFQHSLTVA